MDLFIYFPFLQKGGRFVIRYKILICLSVNFLKGVEGWGDSLLGTWGWREGIVEEITHFN